MQYCSFDVRNFRKRHTLIFVMALFSFCFSPNRTNAQFSEKDTKCEVSLTCSFSEDSGGRKQGFQIFDEQKQNALHCQSKEGNIYCEVGYGYTYDWKRSDSVTVSRVSSHEPKLRKCSCILIDPDYTLQERPCTVTVQEINETTLSETSRHHSDSRNPRTELPEDSSLKSLQSQKETLVLAVVGVSVVAFVLIVLLVIALVILRRYRFVYCGGNECSPASRSNSGDAEAGSENNPLNDPDN